MTRRTWLTIGSILAVATLLAGTVFATDLLLRRESERTQTIAGPITAVRVQILHGNLRVVGEDRTDAVIRSRTTRSLREPTGTTRLESGTVRITSICPETLGDCSVDFELALPRATAISGMVSFGDVQISGIHAEVDVSVLGLGSTLHRD